jgi:hypothetical protein
MMVHDNGTMPAIRVREYEAASVPNYCQVPMYRTVNLSGYMYPSTGTYTPIFRIMRGGSHSHLGSRRADFEWYDAVIALIRITMHRS